MSVVFFVDVKHDGISLALTVACHVLTALAYAVEDVAEDPRLRPEELLARIAAVRRQFVLGNGPEFTADDVDEARLLHHLDQLERMARRARERGRCIRLL